MNPLQNLDGHPFTSTFRDTHTYLCITICMQYVSKCSKYQSDSISQYSSIKPSFSLMNSFGDLRKQCKVPDELISALTGPNSD